MNKKNYVTCQNTCLKPIEKCFNGGFFDESEINFLSLQISAKHVKVLVDCCERSLIY